MSSRPERDGFTVSRSGETRSSGFERQLTSALRPVDAPQGFAARLADLALTSAAHSQPPARVIPMRPRLASPRLPLWANAAGRWSIGAIAAALLLAAFSMQQVHQRHEREQAQHQFDAAMRVTDRALDQTRVKLERTGLKLGD